MTPRSRRPASRCYGDFLNRRDRLRKPLALDCVWNRPACVEEKIRTKMKHKLIVTEIIFGIAAVVALMFLFVPTSVKAKVKSKPEITKREEDMFRLGALIGAELERQHPGKYKNVIDEAAWRALNKSRYLTTNSSKQ